MTPGATMPDMNERIAVLPEDIVEEPNEPKVPPGIYIALVTGITGLLAAYGLPVPERAEDSIVQIVTALVVIIPLAESWLRGKRNDRHAVVQAARAQAPVSTTIVNNNPEG